MSRYLVIAMQTFLKAIDFEVVISDGRANAILTEPAGLDAQ